MCIAGDLFAPLGVWALCALPVVGGSGVGVGAGGGHTYEHENWPWEQCNRQNDRHNSDIKVKGVGMVLSTAKLRVSSGVQHEPTPGNTHHYSAFI